MKQRTKLLTFMSAAAMGCAAAFAMVAIQWRGTFPKSWPQELDAFRNEARTLWIGNGIQETVYEIQFDTRDEFQKAWPYIISLKSKGAPVILEKSPSTFHERPLTAGVRILWPAGGEVGLPDGTRLSTGPPWPASVRLSSGELPEYLTLKGGVMVPYTGQEYQGFLYRARVDVVLIADGLIVKTNDIEIPAQTPIIDKRIKR